MKYANRVDINRLTNYVNKDKPERTNDYFFDDIVGDAWKAFTLSVKNDGIIEPVLITKETNRIISGHQRVRAAKEVGFTEVPVIYATEELQKIVTDDAGQEQYIDDEDKILLCLIETNLKQRGKANPNNLKMGRCIIELERLYGIRHGGDRKSSGNRCQLNDDETTEMTCHPSLTQNDIARMIGISVRTMNSYKRLAELPMVFQNMILAQKLSPTVALNEISPLDDNTQALLIDAIDPQKKYSRKEIQALIATVLGEEAEEDPSDATYNDDSNVDLQRVVDDLTVKNDELTARIASITNQLQVHGFTFDEDGNVIKEKKKRGRPAGSKNKPKVVEEAA